MIERRGRMGMFIGAGAFILAAGLAGCSSLSGGHVDCNVVKLQTQSGRDSAAIASALGVSESDVESCHSTASSGSGGGSGGSGGPPNASEYGIPAGVEGAEGAGAGGSAPPPPPPPSQ
jgi:hypothetical protein